VARDFGADLVHAHLIRASDARAIKASGFPLVMTLHNMPTAWPVGLGAMGDCADFIFACARAVEEAWRAHGESGDVRPPVRTVWNGIDPKPYAPTAASHAAGRAWREARGWGAEDFVIAAIANPRAQKRLHWLPEILHALRNLLKGRTVRLVFAGAHEEGSAEARQSVAEIEVAIERWDVADGVHWTGGTGEVATVLAASDALVSTSAFEGLSLAQLEALAAGVPVVATEVGGTGELASPLLHLLPVDAQPEDFAAVLAELAGVPPAPRAPALPSHFTRYRMATRTRLLYPRVIERAQGGKLGGELWLMANNFSTGGAQSSARRLLLGLAERGVKVRVFTVQEEPDYPTPGRAALLAAGLPVIALPPPERCEAAEATARILEQAAVTPPRAVLFWNLITSYKVLLADGFTETPIYDISPGEMYFAALTKYFAEPRPGLPYVTPRDYGARLAGVVVKFAAEREAAAALGAPVQVIRNGIASVKSGQPWPRASTARGRAVFVIGTAARLSRDKRLGDLLDAFRLALPRLPRCELWIAGGVERGEEEHANELRRHARGLPVRWCGELPGTAAFLAELDLFAMISEPAGCPNASLEAMAAGVPVVATDVGGAAEQVLDGITGRLTPRRDAAALAEALIELAHDAELRERLAVAGAARVREEFSLERMIESYYELCFGRKAARVPEVAAEAVVV
jgi:glycosyltransferase involved in cell wall biosynthesis